METGEDLDDPHRELKDKNTDNNGHHFMANRTGKNGNSGILFSWASKTLWMVTAAMKLKDTCSLEEKL